MTTILLCVFTAVTFTGVGILIGRSAAFKAHNLGMTRGQLLQIAHMIDNRSYRQRMMEWMDTDSAYEFADAINKAHPSVKAVRWEDM